MIEGILTAAVGFAGIMVAIYVLGRIARAISQYKD